MGSKGSMMGSSKYEFDQHKLDKDILAREECFKTLYKEIYDKVIISSTVYQQILSSEEVYATHEGFLDRVLRQLILDIRVGKYLATEEEFKDL